MKLSEAKRRGLVRSPSIGRWMTDGAIPGIDETTQGAARDLSQFDLMTVRVFEIIAQATNSDLVAAYKCADVARQRFLTGNLMPLNLQIMPHVQITFDLAGIVLDIAAAERAIALAVK